MSVTIRLTRGGGKKTPFYRVVAADSRSPRDGRFIEQIGVYDPLREPPEVRFQHDRLHHWMKHGALPSETVGQLIRRLNRANIFEGHPLKDLLAKGSARAKRAPKAPAKA